VNWSNGSLAGGGSLSNYSPIQVSTTTNKTIIGATTLNNHDVISIVDSGDIYITDGVINNHVAGTINLTAAAGNLSWSSGGTHTLNNYGIIRKLGDTGLNAIDCQMNNFGTIEVLAGNLGLTYGGINLNGGVYNISANSFLSISALTNMTGQLSGTIAGEILWTSTVNVPSSEVATFAFTGVGSGNVNWQNGVLSGGGVLVNNFTMRLSSTANKQIIGLTTLQNLALIYIQTSGDLYITDGIVNNMLTGTIDMRADAGERVKLQDHSIFVAFAPRVNPKIAIAVFVENGYWGARWAGPMASLMIEKYLKGKITRTDLEKRMLEGSLQGEYAKYTGKKPVDSLFITRLVPADTVIPAEVEGEAEN
jgi:hypothetical protein